MALEAANLYESPIAFVPSLSSNISDPNILNCGVSGRIADNARPNGPVLNIYLALLAIIFHHLSLHARHIDVQRSGLLGFYLMPSFTLTAEDRQTYTKATTPTNNTHQMS